MYRRVFFIPIKYALDDTSLFVLETTHSLSAVDSYLGSCLPF